LKCPGAPARGNATAKTHDIASAMAGDAGENTQFT